MLQGYNGVGRKDYYLVTLKLYFLRFGVWLDLQFFTVNQQIRETLITRKDRNSYVATGLI